jgi:hypothetical protein
MVNWIANNKEWLFSGIGVVLIVGAVSIVRRFFSKPTPKPEPSSNTPLQSPPSSLTSDLPTTPVMKAEEILRSITSAPLLQQAELAKHYLGIHVDCWGALVNADTDKPGKVAMMILCNSAPNSFPCFVWFEVNLDDYPGLGLLHDGDPIRVSGTFDSISISTVNLKNARLLTYGHNLDRQQTEPGQQNLNR